ncbi:hypothetical protein Taro_013501, partial [Colocasia esculenta]|nr:hypothetical protein [Colocasia esculenta]
IRQGPPQRCSGGVLGVDEPLRGSSSTAQNTPLQVFFPRTAPLPAALASPQHSSQTNSAFSKHMAEYWSNCMRSSSQNLEEH